jgi:ABC-type dipeptide/oligopeptide/nickel transport system permease subunit
MGDMSSAHLIFIPGVLIVGIVIGWVLGARAAHDAFAAELRRREERARSRKSEIPDR